MSRRIRLQPILRYFCGQQSSKMARRMNQAYNERSNFFMSTECAPEIPLEQATKHQPLLDSFPPSQFLNTYHSCGQTRRREGRAMARFSLPIKFRTGSARAADVQLATRPSTPGLLNELSSGAQWQLKYRQRVSILVKRLACSPLTIFHQ
ncbi:hypothetical protein CVT26_013287 [Gymnopilus dilepis]|uniref:Uncharacterized protein n=1 Tax=Gymnopilus dilepis TaxID=231916 RepID=A0A409VUS2_9AGAR|nr:hypothetical protein CVT26_013287 [Gymnopilus dilepis]